MAEPRESPLERGHRRLRPGRRFIEEAPAGLGPGGEVTAYAAHPFVRSRDPAASAPADACGTRGGYPASDIVGEGPRHRPRLKAQPVSGLRFWFPADAASLASLDGGRVAEFLLRAVRRLAGHLAALDPPRRLIGDVPYLFEVVP